MYSYLREDRVDLQLTDQLSQLCIHSISFHKLKLLSNLAGLQKCKSTMPSAQCQTNTDNYLPLRNYKKYINTSLQLELQSKYTIRLEVTRV